MFVPHTLACPVTVTGVGLHTAAAVEVVLRPADAGRGRVFLRDGVEIPALADFVVDTRRCTQLGHGGVSISTVEHLLAALALAAVSDVEIAVNGPELPALDGSAAQWLDVITKAGVCAQGGELSPVRVLTPQWLVLGDAEFYLVPADATVLYAAIDVPETTVRHAMVGGRVDDPMVALPLARARTWALQRDVQALLDAGLARGGSLDNCVVLTADGYLNDHVWPQEPVWHKVLDLLGDLALLGAPLLGQVLAVRAGHRHHVELAQNLRAGHLGTPHGVE